MTQFKRFWSDLPLTVKGFVAIGLPLLSFALAVLLLGLTLQKAQESQRNINASYEVQVQLQNVYNLVLNAGTGVRAFLLTGEQDLLSVYVEAEQGLQPSLEHLTEGLANNPEQLKKFNLAREQIEREFAVLGTLLEYASLLEETAPINGLVITSQVILKALAGQFNTLLETQQGLTSNLETEAKTELRRYYLAIILSLLTCVLSGILGIWLFTASITKRIRNLSENAGGLAKGQFSFKGTIHRDEIGNLEIAFNRAAELFINRELELRQANEAIRLKFNELTQNHHHIILLNQLGTALQYCQSTKEAFEIMRDKVVALCPEHSGSLYLFDKIKKKYRRALVWGDHSVFKETFFTKHCHVPKQGQYYLYSQKSDQHYCEHVNTPYPGMSLCCSLIAQDIPLGLLHITGTNALSDDTRTVLGSMSDRLALALINLNLRDSLLEKAIRDPLTKLYNRRYLEETLEREIKRAKRSGKPLSVLIADIDHFKQVNDTFGHKAGDEILKDFGQLLNSSFRAQDIPCRYGGEEFVVVLPETALQDAKMRAEALAKDVRSLRVTLPSGAVEMISISVGVASYPQHGRTSQMLVSSADTAMYQAKHAGRDQVATALEGIGN